ncbi:MAG: polyphosphate kinase 1 [Cytophagales bacterium]|nr:MAG: polyphosphate kinase 1 [Cytophagales bacterium]TAF60027.1 MAG: polyphosphate kinase 1 [Cytophagales bacterium]
MPSYYDRDLSWLSFNFRVLQEAQDTNLPIYERIKFLAIYSSNLDEFYRVRVAYLRRMLKVKNKEKNNTEDDDGATTMLTQAVLDRIHAEIEKHRAYMGQIYKREILPELAKHDIILYKNSHFEPEHQVAAVHLFKTKILGYLQPIYMSLDKKAPFLQNRALYFAIRLSKKGVKAMALLNIPSDKLDRFWQLPKLNNKHYYVFLDDLIKMNLKVVFPGYDIEECVAIKLNRDADLNLEDEYGSDLVNMVKKKLEKRNLGVPSRFIYDGKISGGFFRTLQDIFGLKNEDCVRGARYHSFYDLMKLPNPLKPQLEQPNIPYLPHPELDKSEYLLDCAKSKDFLLHFPYHSYDYVLRLFSEAAIDPDVREIRVMVYRIAVNSFVANALISATRNGKKVTVFVEVKARFDEANNIRWAKELELAGVKIIYSLPGLKVHAKTALIKRLDEKGELKSYGYFGTGNFNEITAGIYCDYGLLTSNKALVGELESVFNFLDNQDEQPVFRNLLVSKFNMRQGFVGRIQREIDNVRSGGLGRILIKVNNLEDRQMIDALYMAAESGVKVQIIARSVCCINPQHHPNLSVMRIVDTYLEHARIFWFHNNGEEDVFLASADWMRRNLSARIEVAFPLYDPKLKADIFKTIEIQLKDNVKSSVIVNPEMPCVRKLPLNGEKAFRAQMETYAWLKKRNEKKLKTAKSD